MREPQDNSGDNGPSTLEQLLEDARKKLVETGTRNRLIHVNRSHKRANVLNIINERADDIFDILKTRGKKMQFLATGKDSASSSDNETPLLETVLDLEKPFDKTRYTDNKLETPLGPDAQQKRLLRLARDARTAEEEQGVNILYLALGFLTWFEDKSSAQKREAPLILLPVELVRNARTSTYDVRCRDDDLETNLPLAERLRSDFGIELPELETDEENWTPEVYFDRLSAAIAARERWKIDRQAMQLGFFSFAKLLMLRDLDPANWPGPGLGGSGLIAGLLHTGFESQEPLFGRNDRLDEKLTPSDIIQVVDADASQTKIIQEVRAGRNIVVQGPPGTGKSQTIVNMIASAVHDGKSVLFVAEKMAALSVVHDRLKKSGLESLSLELHSRAANKKKVIGELARTLGQGAASRDMPAQPDKLKEARDTLNFIDATLHQTVPDTCQSPFDAMSQMSFYTGQGAPPPKQDGAVLARLSRAQSEQIEEHLETYCRLAETAGVRHDHPFFGTQNLKLQPLDIARLVQKVKDAQEKIGELARMTGSLGQSLAMPVDSPDDVQLLIDVLKIAGTAPPMAARFCRLFARQASVPKLISALQAAQEWQDASAQAGQFSDVAYTVPVSHLRSALASGTGSFFARLAPGYRAAAREFATLLLSAAPEDAADKLRLFDDLIILRAKRQAYSDEEDFLRGVTGTHWQAAQTPFAEILATGDWIEKLTAAGVDPAGPVPAILADDPQGLGGLAGYFAGALAAAMAAVAEIEEALDFDKARSHCASSANATPFQSMITRLQTIADNDGRYGEWCRLANAAARLDENGLGSILQRIDRAELTLQPAIAELRLARAEAVWDLARTSLPTLDQISRLRRHDLVEEFCRYGKARINDVRKLVRARHFEQLPGGAVGEMGIIRGEIARRRGHKPIRKLISAAGSMVQRIKPVLLMSPISVAQFLPPGQLTFDLLVIDEASQVRPEDALGAIARARQIVVVGDKQQLPPTAFFSRMIDTSSDDDDEDSPLADITRATEMESILSLCEARSITSRMLEWHYRSRDPSLIRVSNAEFYENNLVLPPSPFRDDAGYGLKFVRVPGVYSSKSKGSGRPGTNKIEAQAVVDAAGVLARTEPHYSLGIVAFSVAQRDMITELMEYQRRQDPVLDDFLREGKPEDVFVKNIENVQGDERDIILISVGYGPHEAGGRLASMRFGPVNTDGGERRLNVLFSRARVRCVAFASFDPADIDQTRTAAAGSRVLKRFLEFAKSGRLEQSEPDGRAADSFFEEDVARVIRDLGYQTDFQVGSAGFRIDLGIRHPACAGQYMLAVECDGATYHSALWARERDRLRQEVLESLGWTFYRIWSTDWFHRRSQEIDRLRAALERAAVEGEDGVEVPGANAGYSAPDEVEAASDETPADKGRAAPSPPPPSLPSGTPYQLAGVSADAGLEPHEASPATLAGLVCDIVQVEGPVHQDEIARRLATAFGKERSGNRIRDLTVKALKQAANDGVVTDASGALKSAQNFWFTQDQLDAPPVRDRSQLPAAAQKPEMLPPMEIRAAARKILQESGDTGTDELAREVARLFGFQRLGPGLRDVINSQIETLNSDRSTSAD